MDGIALFLMAGFIFLAIAIRLGAGSFDRERIRRHVEEQGGQIVSIIWAPLGPGWLGEKDSRIYEVQYVDPQGNEHRAHCKTSAWSGVYLTNDTVVRRANAPQVRGESLEEENRRLREELDRLRQKGVS